jgi:hypothetical protein
MPDTFDRLFGQYNAATEESNMLGRLASYLLLCWVREPNEHMLDRAIMAARESERYHDAAQTFLDVIDEYQRERHPSSRRLTTRS